MLGRQDSSRDSSGFRALWALEPSDPTQSDDPLESDDPGATQVDLKTKHLESGVTHVHLAEAHHPNLGREWPTFLPNERVSARFTIRRLIADGGMGEVFEAEDTELGERVALKTLRPETTVEPGALRRFRLEVHLARQVTHPNVCRTFDIFHHPLKPSPRSPFPPIVFVSMELLEGVTLSRRVRRQGRLSTRQALPILQQLAAALTAAHEAGVVHRDLKSGNVMLVPSARGERAVVTDFGLARGESGAGTETAAATGAAGTGSGLAGTPAYMAPEQVARGEITPATDIYALGVVIYEMVTGRLPFEGPSPVAAMMRRVREEPTAPRVHVPNLDPRWQAAILRCLRRDPKERFASPQDVVAALEPPVTPARPFRSRWRTAAVAVCLALVAAFGWEMNRSQRLPGTNLSEPASSTSARLSLAVVGFRNLSGRDSAAWLSVALSELLSVELAAGKALRVVPGESVARMKLELALAETADPAADTLARVRTYLGSDLVVVGSYLATGTGASGVVRVDLRLLNAHTGELVAAVSEEGTEAGLFELVERTAARVRGSLGLSEIGGAGGLRASLPSDPEAARLYVAGLEELRQFDALSARRVLERAVAIEPTAPLPHSALAQAWAALGYDGRSEAAAQRAFELARGLPKAERLLVEGRYREAGKEWGRAIEIYTSLWNFFPDQAEYGLRLAAVQTSAGRGIEALATLADLRQLPLPAADDPRIDLAEAVAAYSLSEFSRSETAASRAVNKARRRGTRLLAARALVEQGQAAWRVGDSARALVAVEEAAGILTELGERGGQAGTLRLEGNILLVQGSLAQAMTTYEQALAIYREIGHAAGISKVLNNIAIVRQRQGDLEAARETYVEALQIAREIGDPVLISGKLNNLGIVLDLEGDLEGARGKYEEALQIAREIGDRGGMASRMNNLAKLQRRQGDLESSERLYRQAVEIWRQIDDRRDLAYTLNDLGALLITRGNLAAARRICDEALTIRVQLGDAGDAAVTRLVLSILAIEEGRARQAEALARQALEEFRLEKRTDNQASATVLLARSLLMRGDVSSALVVLERAQELLAGSSDVERRLTVELHAARAAGAAGRSAAALDRLEQVRSEAAETGMAELQLSARLAQAEIETGAGIAGGRDRLSALEREATATGFELIAAKARRLLADGPSRPA